MATRFLYNPELRDFTFVDCVPLLDEGYENLFVLSIPAVKRGPTDPKFPDKCIYLAVDRMLIMIPGLFRAHLKTERLDDDIDTLKEMVRLRYSQLFVKYGKVCVDRKSWVKLDGDAEQYDLMIQKSKSMVSGYWEKYQGVKGLYNINKRHSFILSLLLTSFLFSVVINPVSLDSAPLYLLGSLCFIACFKSISIAHRFLIHSVSFKLLRASGKTPKEIIEEYKPLYNHCITLCANHNSEEELAQFNSLYSKVISGEASRKEISEVMSLMFTRIGHYHRERGG